MPFYKFSDPNLLKESLDIITAMTGNTYFPTPVPTLEEMGGFIGDFQELLTASASGERTKVKLKNQARVALITGLKDLGTYVTFTAKADIAKLTSSGFPLRKTPQPVIVNKPNLKVTNGPNSGEVINEATKVGKNRGFLHQVTADPVTENIVWDSYSTTSKKYTFTGLHRAKIYWCRVAAVGAKNQLIFSDPVSIVVL